MNTQISHEGLAAAQAYFMGLDAEWIPSLTRHLVACDELGQLRRFFGKSGRCYGYIAWVRVEHRHVSLLKEKDWPRLFRLSRRELTTGPILYVMDTMTVVGGWSARAARQLSHLPGVERITAHVKDRWRERRVVHHG